MKASTSSVHPASLVDPALHSPAMLELLEIKLTKPIIEYTVDAVIDTVAFAMGRPLPSASSSQGHRTPRTEAQTKFASFVSTVVTRAEVITPTLLGALAYIDRARPHLHIALEEWACERVFLGALMTASKYLNDSTLKNLHWAMCTGVFGKRDVGRIEREFLSVLDFELSLSESDILAHHQGLMSVSSRRHHRSSTAAPTKVPSRKHIPVIVISDDEDEDMEENESSSSSLPQLQYPSTHHHRSLSSSSSSSSESSSPQTPADAASAPLPAKKQPAAHHLPRVHELLRAFPIPGGYRSNSASPARSSRPQPHPVAIRA